MLEGLEWIIFIVLGNLFLFFFIVVVIVVISFVVFLVFVVVKVNVKVCNFEGLLCYWIKGYFDEVRKGICVILFKCLFF